MPKRKTVDKEYQDLVNVDLPALQKSVQNFFPKFPDPRIQSKCLYPAWYLILIILCGYLSNCNTVADISYFAEARGVWLNSSLNLNFKIPSYDTIWWFLVRIKPQGLKDLMSQWLVSLPSDLQDQLLIVDGKRLRGVSNNEHVSHLVELFAAQSRLVIRQERVPDKSCERKALPQLLGNIDVKGAIISFDAHFTYKGDLQYVREQGADYKEDESLANTGYIAENMSLFRRLTMNVVRTFDPKRGVADARRGATYDPNYLLGLLSRLFKGKC
jgi:hypothetical protein